MYKEVTSRTLNHKEYKIIAIESLESDRNDDETTVFSATILNSDDNFLTYRKGLDLDEAINKCKTYIDNQNND